MQILKTIIVCILSFYLCASGVYCLSDADNTLRNRILGTAFYFGGVLLFASLFA